MLGIKYKRRGVRCIKYLCFKMADESEEGAVTYKLRKFTETDKVNFILDSIPEACKTITKTERALQDLREILDRYQEQPHLLDPYL
ncbi:Hypothetical predicted protein, partial [Paramuricea clavata]